MENSSEEKRDYMDRPDDDINNGSSNDSTDSGGDGGEGKQEDEKKGYDPSTNPKVYPNSLTSLTQADAAAERMNGRVEWILERLNEIKGLVSETQDTATKQTLIAEYDRLIAEVKSLKDKRPLLSTKRATLKEEADKAIEEHQFEDINWD